MLVWGWWVPAYLWLADGRACVREESTFCLRGRACRFACGGCRSVMCPPSPPFSMGFPAKPSRCRRPSPPTVRRQPSGRRRRAVHSLHGQGSGTGFHQEASAAECAAAGNCRPQAPHSRKGGGRTPAGGPSWRRTSRRTSGVARQSWTPPRTWGAAAAVLPHTLSGRGSRRWFPLSFHLLTP